MYTLVSVTVTADSFCVLSQSKSTAWQYPSNGTQLTQYIKLTVRERVAVLTLAGFSVSLYLVSLYKCGPVRLFSGRGDIQEGRLAHKSQLVSRVTCFHSIHVCVVGLFLLAQWECQLLNGSQTGSLDMWRT